MTIIQHHKIPNNTNCIILIVTEQIKTHIHVHTEIILIILTITIIGLI